MEIIINKSKQRLLHSLQALEQLISKKLAQSVDAALNEEILLLKKQIITLQQENIALKELKKVVENKVDLEPELQHDQEDQEHVSEIRNSIQIIEDFFKKDNGNSKD